MTCRASRCRMGLGCPADHVRSPAAPQMTHHVAEGALGRAIGQPAKLDDDGPARTPRVPVDPFGFHKASVVIPLRGQDLDMPSGVDGAAHVLRVVARDAPRIGQARISR